MAGRDKDLNTMPKAETNAQLMIGKKRTKVMIYYITDFLCAPRVSSAFVAFLFIPEVTG